MKDKKRRKLLRKARTHAGKVVKRTTQLAAMPELEMALELEKALNRRRDMEEGR